MGPVGVGVVVDRAAGAGRGSGAAVVAVAAVVVGFVSGTVELDEVPGIGQNGRARSPDRGGG